MKDIVIKNFRSEIEAEAAKNFLAENGIKSFVQKQGVHSSGVPNGNAGIDLIILEKDIEKAKELLEELEK